MTTLAYKSNAGAVLDRLRALFERRAQDQIFAVCTIPALTAEPLEDFARRYPDSRCGYPDPDERIAFWDRMLHPRTNVDDDSIPSAYPTEFDQGLYGGLVGGDARFMPHPDNGWISSMVAPLLDDWSQFDALHIDEGHSWWERFERQLRAFVAGSEGTFGVSHFILIDSLNFVFELVGATKTYESLMDCADAVRRAVDFAFELNVTVQRRFFELVPLLAGGTYSNMAQWIPGRIVSESLDPFHMTSVDYFEEWGREPVERMFRAFDGGVIHLHGNGRHLLEAACTIRGLKAILLANDTGFPLAFDVLPELRARAGDMPFVVAAEHDAFVERLKRHTLIGGVLYSIDSVLDIDSANRLMEAVRAYRV